jgi:polysaccharide export outer membrane protein
MSDQRSALALLALVIAGACGLLGACGGGAVHYDYKSEPDPRKTEYVIGVSDRLAIRVWKNPDLSGDVVVRPDGTITLPLLGDMNALALTPTQLKENIQKNLMNYIRDENAVVTVAVTGINSYSVTVSGNVEHPGVFKSEKYLTVTDAVQLAGGLNRYASGDQAKIFRTAKDGKIRTIPVNVEAVQAGKQPEANLALVTGDQLYVP